MMRANCFRCGFSTIFLIQFLAVPCFSQIGCYVPGECKSSQYTDATSGLNSSTLCHEFCIAIDDCKFFTFFGNDRLCLAFTNCIDFDANSCDNCTSGDRDCNLRQCFVPGKCLGNVEDQQTGISSASDCLEKCQELAECHWWTFDASNGFCILTSDCVFLDESCDTCTTGQGTCGRQRLLL